MSILTHKREQRKQQQERRRGLICASLRGRKTVPPLVPPPSFLLLCRVSSFCSLLEQHQRQSDAGEDAGEDAGDGEMTVCVCVTGLHVELCVEDPELLSALTRWTLARPVGMEMDARCLFAQWTAASKQTSSCFLSTLSVAGRVRRL